MKTNSENIKNHPLVSAKNQCPVFRGSVSHKNCVQSAGSGVKLWLRTQVREPFVHAPPPSTIARPLSQHRRRVAVAAPPPSCALPPAGALRGGSAFRTCTWAGLQPLSRRCDTPNRCSSDVCEGFFVDRHDEKSVFFFNVHVFLNEMMLHHIIWLHFS